MSKQLEGSVAKGHLLRRAGFGPDVATWESWADLSYDQALERVLADLDAPLPADPSGFTPHKVGTIQQTWLERMRHAPVGLAEKLALFWHGHFASSEAKGQDPEVMWRQYRMFREKGAGSLRDLVLAVSRDVAMVRFLDGNANRKGHPNENYGRELQELFTLGIGNYTEEDIREISRAFTGWGTRHHSFVFSEHFHDDGEKTFHGKTGHFGGEEAIDILLALPACTTLIAGKLLRFFSHLDPTAAEVEELATVLRSSKLQIKPTLAALFRAPAFREKRHYRALVRSPTEFAVGALRAVGAEEVPEWIHGSLDRMGQILFRPPSVKGWTSGTGWLSSGAVVERLTSAQRIALELAQAGAADTILDVALQGDVPAALTEVLVGRTGKDRIATVLGGPEFQLS